MNSKIKVNSIFVFAYLPVLTTSVDVDLYVVCEHPMHGRRVPLNVVVVLLPVRGRRGLPHPLVLQVKGVVHPAHAHLLDGDAAVGRHGSGALLLEYGLRRLRIGFGRSLVLRSSAVVSDCVQVNLK